MLAPTANRRSLDHPSVITLKQTMNKVVQSFRKVKCSWYKVKGQILRSGTRLWEHARLLE